MVALVAATIGFTLIGVLAIRAALVSSALLVVARIVSPGVAGGPSTVFLLGFLFAATAPVFALAGFAVCAPVCLAGLIHAVVPAGRVFRLRSVLVALSGSLSFAGAVSPVLRIARRLVRVRLRCRVVVGPPLA